MPDPINLQVVIPLHQPINASEQEIEAAIERCYAPLLEVIAERAKTRLALYLSGHLLDYLASRRHGMLGKLKALVGASQVEILGGLYQGGISALLPEMDVRGQVEMMSGFWESYVGTIPKGFWLPEMAWSVELPRLLVDSELEYGFAASSQLTPPPREGTGLGVMERGEANLGIFAVDEPLSRGLLNDDVDSWVDGLLDRAGAGQPGKKRITTVTVRAEALGLDPGSHERCHAGGWLASWLEAISGGRQEIKTVLPASAYKEMRPAQPVSLRCACELESWEPDERPFDWPEYARRYPEAGVLFRRMLHVSDKLREFIAAMEDEELEEDWSDTLATAQRLLFAAQTPDAYWHGRIAGFVDPALRDAVMSRLIQATNMLDELVQGDDDWIGAEEDDRDHDLIEEIIVSTARTMVWLVPARGGLVRCMDNRHAERTLLDTAVHRHQRDDEPEASAMEQMANDATLIDLPSGSTAGASAQTIQPGRGITTWILEGDTQLEEIAGGNAVDLVPADVSWEISDNSIDEEGDCSYRMSLEGAFDLLGTSARRVEMTKTLTVPIDAAVLTIAYDARLTGDSEVVIATEIPLRLATAVEALVLNGTTRPIANEELADATRIRLECPTPEGEAEIITLTLSEPTDVWCVPIGKGGREGIELVPILRLEGEGSLTITLDVDGHGETAADEIEPEPLVEARGDDEEAFDDAVEEPADEEKFEEPEPEVEPIEEPEV